MSQLGHSLPFGEVYGTSALPPTTDVMRKALISRDGPMSDIAAACKKRPPTKAAS